MTEKKMRQVVVQMLKPIAAFSVENPVNPGTPDVCTILGWMELKLGHTQQRPESPVRVKVRKIQRIFMRNWRKFGGAVWTLTLVDGKTWILHDGAWSADHLGEANEEEMKANALYCSTKLTRDVIHAMLKSRRDDVDEKEQMANQRKD